MQRGRLRAVFLCVLSPITNGLDGVPVPHHCFELTFGFSVNSVGEVVMLDHEFKKQRARTVRELADKAVDPFIKKRLQDLAARYEDDGLKPPTKLTPIDVEFANRGAGARAISSITDGTTPASRARAEGKAEITADSRPTPVKEVTATINGAMHYGAYFVKQSTVYVKSSHGIKSRVVRESSPEDIAKRLLSELVGQKPSGGSSN
jgi:hypothetical protein